MPRTLEPGAKEVQGARSHLDIQTLLQHSKGTCLASSATSSRFLCCEAGAPIRPRSAALLALTTLYSALYQSCPCVLTREQFDLLIHPSFLNHGGLRQSCSFSRFLRNWRCTSLGQPTSGQQATHSAGSRAAFQLSRATFVFQSKDPAPQDFAMTRPKRKSAASKCVTRDPFKAFPP